MCLACLVGMLASCSGSDYLNAIPKKSTAIISVDMQQMASDVHAEDKAGMLKSLLHVDDVDKCGIDISEKMYLFESADGNLGLCAKVSSESDVEDWLASLAKQHIASEVKERKGFHFAVLKDSWLVGFSDKALLVMGPVVADAQAQLQQQMVRYLKADEEEGITASPLFERLQTITSPMAMVAQAQALPEKFIAPFTLGAPKDTDPSQVVIAAEMNVKDGILQIHGETFSFNKTIDAALQKAIANYRPIKGNYVKSMPGDALAGIFMNVKGEQFLPMMQSSSGLQTLLMGINQAVDMDNIIRSVDGDMAFFGVTDDKQFYSGSDELTAQYAVKPSNHPIDAKIQKLIVGQKLAMVINLAKSSDGNGSGKDDAISTVTSLLSPVFGNLTSVVYTLKVKG